MFQAVDFGTTYSGYAFTFIHDPEEIHMMRKWEGTNKSRDVCRFTLRLIDPRTQVEIRGSLTPKRQRHYC